MNLTMVFLVLTVISAIVCLIGILINKETLVYVSAFFAIFFIFVTLISFGKDQEKQLWDGVCNDVIYTNVELDGRKETYLIKDQQGNYYIEPIANCTWQTVDNK